jgi:hypothetical protein
MPVMAESAWLDDGIVIGIVDVSWSLKGSPRASNPLTGRDFTEAQQRTARLACDGRKRFADLPV